MELLDIEGLEYEWIAQDRLGQVGVFSTNGGLLIPEKSLSHLAEYDPCIDRIISSPATSSVFYVQPESSMGDFTMWVELAKRGVFAFDYCVVYRHYTPVVRPSAPVVYDCLGCADVLAPSSVAVFDIDFSECASIDREVLDHAARS